MFGCIPKPGRLEGANPLARAVESPRTLLLRIEDTPRESFLAAVSRSVELTAEEKSVIQRTVSRGPYTHCDLTKYLRDDKLFIELHRFFPRRVLGKDGTGHVEFEGGRGSLITYELRKGQPVPVGGYHYD
jgi:hypothetical protein